jgi:hypothetical protein
MGRRIRNHDNRHNSLKPTIRGLRSHPLELTMVKSTKTQHLREKIRTASKKPGQTTLDSIREVPHKESDKAVNSEQKKQIVITGIGTATKEDELALKVDFRLLPSRTAFSKITSELHFDSQKLKSVRISIPQTPIATNDFELTPVLDMKGINPGLHTIKVEMYEQWSSGEKLACTSKEVTVAYVPKSREDRLVKIPTVKSIAGTDLAIASDSEKSIYREIEESIKKELISKRDEW